MGNFKTAQRAYDNAVPDWYWEGCEKPAEHEDEPVISRIEDDLYQELLDGGLSERDYFRAIGLLDDYRSGDISLKQLNNKF